MIFIDTNYFLRLLDDDKSDLHKKAHDLFLKAATSTETYMTSILVLFEVYWVLKSFYHQDKMQCVFAIESILKMDFVEIADRKILQQALVCFSQSSLELEDCFHLEQSKAAHCTGIATFDAKLSRAFED